MVVARIHPLTYCVHSHGQAHCGLTTWGFWSILLIAAALVVVVAIMASDEHVKKQVAASERIATALEEQAMSKEVDVKSGYEKS